MKATLILLAGIISLSACNATVRDGNSSIHVNDDGYYGGNGKFCPPGQAKKGNC